ICCRSDFIFDCIKLSIKSPTTTITSKEWTEEISRVCFTSRIARRCLTKICLLNSRVSYFFCWPYRWEKTIDDVLVQRLGEDIQEWFNTVSYFGKVTEKRFEQINDIAHSTIYFCSSEWLSNASTDKKAYEQVLTFFKATLLIAMLDDCTDINVQEEQLPDQFYLDLAQIVFYIFSFKISTVEKLQQEIITLKKYIPSIGYYLKCLLDISKTLQVEFETTTETAQYLAHQFRCFLSYEFGAKKK
ncbi:unnamed protein product, partial [Allacma fusca]